MYLIENNRKSTTIRSYVLAIKAVLWELDVEITDNSVLLSSLMKVCHLKNDRAWNKLPIRCGMLQLILTSLKQMFHQQPYLLALYRVLFMTAYFKRFRIGELSLSNHTVKACDVHVGFNKEKLMFVLQSLKTHNKASKPQIVKMNGLHSIQQHWTNITKICPFMILRQYLSFRKSYVDNDEQFFIFRDRSPVKQSHVRNILSKAIVKARLQPINYSFGGFRSVRASDLLEQGVSVETIRKIGRWKSNSVYTYLHT